MPDSPKPLDHPLGGLLLVGRIEEAHVADGGDGRGQGASGAIPSPPNSARQVSGVGISQVLDDAGDRVGVQRLRPAHQHEPLAAEQAQRVAGRDDVDGLLPPP